MTAVSCHVCKRASNQCTRSLKQLVTNENVMTSSAVTDRLRSNLCRHLLCSFYVLRNRRLQPNQNKLSTNPILFEQTMCLNIRSTPPCTPSSVTGTSFFPYYIPEGYLVFPTYGLASSMSIINRPKAHAARSTNRRTDR